MFNTVTKGKEVGDRLTSCSSLNRAADDGCCEMEIRAGSPLGISQYGFLIHGRRSYCMSPSRDMLRYARSAGGNRNQPLSGPVNASKRISSWSFSESFSHLFTSP